MNLDDPTTDSLEDQPLVSWTVWSGQSNNDFLFSSLLFDAALGNAVGKFVLKSIPQVGFFILFLHM